MKISDLSPGQLVAVSCGLATKHLNIIDDHEADLELVEWDRLAGLAALSLLIKGRRGWLARRLRDQAWPAWDKPHLGTVREVGLPWSGRKVGVLVALETDDKVARWLQAFGVEELTVTVPASMIKDYWDCMAELEAEKAKWKQGIAARTDKSIADLLDEGEA